MYFQLSPEKNDQEDSINLENNSNKYNNSSIEKISSNYNHYAQLQKKSRYFQKVIKNTSYQEKNNHLLKIQWQKFDTKIMNNDFHDIDLTFLENNPQINKNLSFLNLNAHKNP